MKQMLLGLMLPLAGVAGLQAATLGLVFRLSLQRFCSCWFRTDAP